MTQTQPFLKQTEICAIGDTHRYHVCVVPAAQYPDISRAFDLLGNINRVRDTNGLVARLGDSLIVIVPDTVALHTLVHEAVHLAVWFGFTVQNDEDEEKFAHAVAAITTDLIDAIQTLRGTFERAVSTKRKRR